LKLSKRLILIVFTISAFSLFIGSSVIATTDNTEFPVINQDPTIDGIITSNEYDYNSSFAGGDFIIYWTISSNEIYFGMVGNALGYLSIGFEPTKFMKDADMVVGWVFPNSTVSVIDAYCTGNFGPHPPDVDLGGTTDLLEFNGSENLSSTTIEFRRLLFSGDQYDADLSTTGDISIIWAISNSDDFDASHSERGGGVIDLNQGTSTTTTPIPLWLFHAILMVLGFVSMLSAVIIARFFKMKKWRIKTHRRISIAASVTSIAGLILSFIMVSNHLTIVHHFFGVIAFPFVVMMPILGYLFTRNLQDIPVLRKLNPHRKTIRKVHRWMGYITLLLMLGSIISGIIRAFA